MGEDPCARGLLTDLWPGKALRQGCGAWARLSSQRLRRRAQVILHTEMARARWGVSITGDKWVRVAIFGPGIARSRSVVGARAVHLRWLSAWLWITPPQRYYRYLGRRKQLTADNHFGRGRASPGAHRITNAALRNN